MVNDISVSPLSIKELFYYAWDVFSKNIVAILKIAFLFSFPQAIINPSSPYFSIKSFPYLISYKLTSSIINFALTALLTMAIAYLVEEFILGYNVTAKRAILMAKLRLFSGIKTDLLITVLVGFGLILFIIPGIYFGVLYMFGMYVVILRDRSGSAAVDYSAEVVDGNWWRVFGISVFLLVMFIVPTLLMNKLISSVISSGPVVALISGIINCFVIPYLHIFNVVLFLSLDYKKNGCLKPVKTTSHNNSQNGRT